MRENPTSQTKTDKKQSTLILLISALSNFRYYIGVHIHHVLRESTVMSALADVFVNFIDESIVSSLYLSL